jgi:penicillin-binding protein 1C
MYAANAPFGGNVVGLDAASWRYYGKPADKLSWGEAAALAVLPNSPAMVHPGRNRQTLLEKRNRLLKKLKQQGKIDHITYELAKWEPLPNKPIKLPAYSPQLLTRFYVASKKNPQDMLVHSTIDYALQQRVNKIVDRNYAVLSGNGVYNAAAIVLDVRTGNVLAYTGNVFGDGNPEHNGQVDNVTAPRSTGSILKPFLYASMLQDGAILPGTLVPDVPMYINSFTPKNFNYEYSGAVPAGQALARSLNIPSVSMLQKYTPDRFSDQLRRLGLTTINKPGSHYGLTLILGGAEANLWELGGTYASMGRTLLRYNETGGKYLAADFHQPNSVKEKTIAFDTKEQLQPNAPVLGAGSIWLTFQAMLEVARPDEDRYWGEYASARKIAWKTGTSFGNRDAWAIGVTPEYVVAVWAGNSSGEGRAGLTGINSAAPILFDIFNVLPRNSHWFKRPESDLRKIKVCKQSGHIPNEYCTEQVDAWVPIAGLNTRPCPYHRMINLDHAGKSRVTSECESVSEMVRKSWFVLPPVQESYYKLRHPEYAELPRYKDGCAPAEDVAHTMSLVYPQDPTLIYLPVNLDGTVSSAVFEATHRDANAIIYWHLDETYLGSTQSGNHKMQISPEEGKHKLTLVDNEGRKLRQTFEIMRKSNDQLASGNKQ